MGHKLVGTKFVRTVHNVGIFIDACLNGCLFHVVEDFDVFVTVICDIIGSRFKFFGCCTNDGWNGLKEDCIEVVWKRRGNLIPCNDLLYIVPKFRRMFYYRISNYRVRHR